MCATPIKEKKETALTLSGQQQLPGGSGPKYEICNGYMYNYCSLVIECQCDGIKKVQQQCRAL